MGFYYYHLHRNTRLLLGVTSCVVVRLSYITCVYPLAGRRGNRYLRIDCFGKVFSAHPAGLIISSTPNWCVGSSHDSFHTLPLVLHELTFIGCFDALFHGVNYPISRRLIQSSSHWKLKMEKTKRYEYLRHHWGKQGRLQVGRMFFVWWQLYIGVVRRCLNKL